MKSTRKLCWETLDYGSCLGDMHYGIPENLDEIFDAPMEIVEHRRYTMIGAHTMIEETVRAKNHAARDDHWHYTNKAIVAVGFKDVSVIFAYSYDGLSLGFIEIRRK